MMKAKTLVLLATVAVVALGSHLGRIRPAPGPCRRPRPGDSHGRSVQSLVRRDPSDKGHSQRHRLAEPVPGVLGRMGDRVHVLQRCELGHGRERLSRRAAVSHTITGLSPGEYEVHVCTRYDDNVNGPFKKSADRTNVFEAAHLHRLPREGLRHRGQRLLPRQLGPGIRQRRLRGPGRAARRAGGEGI